MHNKGNSPSILIINDAIKSNKLYELFVGKYHPGQSPYGTTPTDSIFIFESWIEYVSLQIDYIDLWKLFQDTLIKISLDKDFCWFSAYYLNKLVGFCQIHNLSFIDIQLLIDKIINNVIQHKEQLIKDYRWAGEKDYSFSLWNDFVRLVKIMQEKSTYNFHLEQLI